MIESSQLMKKVFKAVHKDSLTIIAYVKYTTVETYFALFSSSISLALIHILFFAVMAMFLFPKSDVYYHKKFLFPKKTNFLCLDPAR